MSVNDIIMCLQGNNINFLKQLPFYGRTIEPRIKEFTNAKLLSELLFFEKPIKAKIKQLTTKKLPQEQPFYKKSTKRPCIKKLKNCKLLLSYHFMMISIFQEKKGHLEGMPKPTK